MSIIDENSILRRKYWIEEIQKISLNFGVEAQKIEDELNNEIRNSNISTLVNHLRLCGNIPERFKHDSTEEKLYSKYTDVLLALSFRYLGYKSIVIKERGDVADVEVFADNFSFIADAKSFRLSRTAKNQKDFKISAMNNWKRGKEYAILVCPIYQLPNFTSQIYHQATTFNVCIFTYSHLSLILKYAEIDGTNKARELLESILKLIAELNPSKTSTDYWLPINKTILSFNRKLKELWLAEKEASGQCINYAKEEALQFLAEERERIFRLSHEDAINELIKVMKIENKIKTINKISDNGLLNLN